MTIAPIFLPQKGNILIWANTLFLFIMLYLGWVAPITIVFAYFLETFIIGILNVVKMSMCNIYAKEPAKWYDWVIVPFFIFHFGMFIGVQSIFGFMFFKDSVPGLDDSSILDSFMTILHLPGMYLVLGSILTANLGYFFGNFIGQKKYLSSLAKDIMFEPYIRVFIQQFVVIFSGFLMVLFNGGYAAAILLLFFRLITDLAIAYQKNGHPEFFEQLEKYAEEKEKMRELKEKMENTSE